MRRRAHVSAVKLLLATLLLSVSMPLSAQTHAAAGERTAVPEHYSGATVDRASASSQPQAVRDSVDENFVIASLLISEPGGALFSRLGHAALHMQCPEHGLDYIFSYEAEDIKERPICFLAGKLRMGMTALDPQEYIDEQVRQGRGLKEYRLNLPVENKREMWRALDNHLMEGMELKYDYLRYGCAHSTLMMIKEGLGGTKIQYGAWPDYFKGKSRREVTWHHIHEDKWTTFLMHFIVNGSIDRLGCTAEEKVIIPADLPFVLQNATIEGTPIINSAPRQIVSQERSFKTGRFSPLTASLMLLVLTVVCALLKIKAMDYTLLALQTLLGLFAVFLLCSSLVCTEWSWLIVPFNPLPLIFWKWRCHWALPYAVILLVWCAFMLFWPHLLTDAAYVVLTLCLVANYLSLTINNICIKNNVI